MDVISAKNEYALKSSLNQLKGSVRQAIEEIRKKLIYEIARIESALDDPEHMSPGRIRGTARPCGGRAEAEN